VACATTASSYLSWILISKNSATCSVGHISMASHAIRSQTWTQILQPMHSSNRICTFGITTFTPSDVSRGVCSMQSTGQKLTHASHPVQLSGMTTAISFGFFFLRVILAGASGIIRVGFAFFGSYAMRSNCSANRVPAELLDCNVRDEYAKFGDLNDSVGWPVGPTLIKKEDD